MPESRLTRAAPLRRRPGSGRAARPSIEFRRASEPLAPELPVGIEGIGLPQGKG